MAKYFTTLDGEIFKKRCELEERASSEWFNKWGWLSEEYKYTNYIIIRAFNIFFFFNNQLINYIISRQRRQKLNEVRPTMIKDILNTDVRIIPPFPRTTSREVKQF